MQCFVDPVNAKPFLNKQNLFVREYVHFKRTNRTVFFKNKRQLYSDDLYLCHPYYN